MQLRLVGEGVGEQFATKFGPPPAAPNQTFLDPPLLSPEISREFIKEQNIHSIN